MGSKPEEKVYASMAKYLERKDTENFVIPNKERAYFVLEICRFWHESSVDSVRPMVLRYRHLILTLWPEEKLEDFKN